MGEERRVKRLTGFIASPGEGKLVLDDSPRTAERVPLRRGNPSTRR